MAFARCPPLSSAACSSWEAAFCRAFNAACICGCGAAFANEATASPAAPAERTLLAAVRRVNVRFHSSIIFSSPYPAERRSKGAPGFLTLPKSEGSTGIRGKYGRNPSRLTKKLAGCPRYPSGVCSVEVMGTKPSRLEERFSLARGGLSQSRAATAPPTGFRSSQNQQGRIL